jgi:hypothetical protein
MILYAHNSDRTGERRWHAALGTGIAGVTLAMGGIQGITGWPGVALVTCTAVALMCTQAVFWSLPTSVYRARPQPSASPILAATRRKSAAAIWVSRAQ